MISVCMHVVYSMIQDSITKNGIWIWNKWWRKMCRYFIMGGRPLCMKEEEYRYDGGKKYTNICFMMGWDPSTWEKLRLIFEKEFFHGIVEGEKQLTKLNKCMKR